MKLTIDHGLGLKLGYLELDGCSMALGRPATAIELDATIAEITRSLTVDSLARDAAVQGMRRLFKAIGVDPSRYRPSAEALLRRVLKGKALDSINAIVDINNICSLRSRLPLGCYDRERIVGDVHVRLGGPEEKYEGIGREIDSMGKPVAVDEAGPFGSPIADSARTKVTTATREVLVLAYAPSDLSDARAQCALQRFASLAREHAGARCLRTGIAT